MSLSLPTRITALQAGLWQTHTGKVVHLHAMHDAHLVNALLKSLAEGEPREIVEPLSAEVVRRNLREMAFRMVEERS